jgi:hypothetical protein
MSASPPFLRQRRFQILPGILYCNPILLLSPGHCTPEVTTQKLQTLDMNHQSIRDKHFTIAKDSETDKGKETITPPAPKKSFLDRASNRLARAVAQIRTGHWLCAPYLKRVRKNREEQVSDKCWWCGQYRMSRTHVFLRCMHPKLEGARKDFWDRPDEDGKIRKRPTSVGQLLGKSKWEKPLADWITATGVGLVGQDRVDKEDERVERNDGWRREPFLEE